MSFNDCIECGSETGAGYYCSKCGSQVAKKCPKCEQMERVEFLSREICREELSKDYRECFQQRRKIGKYALTAMATCGIIITAVFVWDISVLISNKEVLLANPTNGEILALLELMNTTLLEVVYAIMPIMFLCGIVFSSTASPAVFEFGSKKDKEKFFQKYPKYRALEKLQISEF
ncbi:hypothetical protein ACFL3M_02965 [Patescibacteria group bacterium]